MRTLQEQLCLNRANFQINPKQSYEDAKLYFGKDSNEELIRDIRRGYLAGYVPRIYIYGNYGTGKTHLLYHLKHYFDTEGGTPLKVKPFVVQVEAESRTRYQALHKKLLDAIGLENLEKAYQEYGFQAGAERQAKFRELFPDPNLFLVLQLMQAGPANRTLAWRWLTGERLSASEQSQLGVTSSLTETGDLVETLISIGELFKRTGSHVLFLIDEGEGLHNVTNSDSQRSWHDAFRRLADPNDNQSIGWMLTFYQTLNDQPPTFMFEGDITSRLGRGGQVPLPTLAPVEVESFLKDLLVAFVNHTCAATVISEAGGTGNVELYPFTQSGFKAFIDQAASVPENSIPRTILRAVTSCALEALTSDQRFFDADLVTRIVPAEFAELA
jgi:hypothetical protein